jgi:hypothetical protein
MATSTISSLKKVIGTSTDVLDSSAFKNYTWTESAVIGANTFNISKDTTKAALNLTGVTGDILNIKGYSGDYTASLSSSKLTLDSNNQVISVTLAKSSTVTLKFLDGNKIVDFTSAKTPKLDGVSLTSKALHIDGVTAHAAVALTDTSGTFFKDINAAIAANVKTALTGTSFGTIQELLTSYNAYKQVAPTFSVTSTSSTLEGTDAAFTISLSAILDVSASVSIALTGVGKAIAGTDYNINGTVTGAKGGAGNVLTFAPGQITAIVKFPVLPDTISETGEGLALTLTAVKDSVIGVKTGAVSATTKIDDPTSTLNIDATTKTVTATLGVDTFNIAVGAYTSTIQNFAKGDKLHFFTSASVIIPSDTNTSDGIKQITATDTTGNLTTIILTGLSSAQDAGITDVNSFNTIFGSDSFTL